MQAKMSALQFIMVIAVEYPSCYNYIGSRASVCYRSNTVSAPLFEHRKAPPLRSKVLRRTVRRDVWPSTENEISLTSSFQALYWTYMHDVPEQLSSSETATVLQLLDRLF